MLLFKTRLDGVTMPAKPAMECAPCPPAKLQPAGSELLGPVTRGSILTSEPPAPPPSKQKQLDTAVGPGKYVVDASETAAACQRCSRFNKMIINLSHRAWLANATAHMATHLSGTGMRGLPRCTPLRL